VSWYLPLLEQVYAAFAAVEQLTLIAYLCARAWFCRTALIVSRLLQLLLVIVGGGPSGPCSANDGIVELGIASIQLYNFEEAVCASIAEALFYSSNPSIGAHVRYTLAYGLYLAITDCI
jgi:hypothetical protein